MAQRPAYTMRGDAIGCGAGRKLAPLGGDTPATRRPPRHLAEGRPGQLHGRGSNGRGWLGCTVLAADATMRIERIVSHGQASPPGFWYDQDGNEWVLVVSGSAGLMIEGEKEARTFRRGDHVLIPAHVRHRVEWTDANEPTVWLAVHYR